jgi:hypothetical protein
MDEMWSRVYCKETPCWLWHAVNHEMVMWLHMCLVLVNMKHWGAFGFIEPVGCGDSCGLF